ncbi:hypothetical protein FB567DRAFT_354018 [Paraphoma chrysanthemicola]|uniref:Protein kinase domain-containing protein n=1 Tax=Paraphoma chrysanthemicola TaxID=798071 RepID=A0A8K0R899_9PLEO|nr:hypothetical protein FB567DRAFT_354018 [Paraphoma chrysanthemicola]
MIPFLRTQGRLVALLLLNGPTLFTVASSGLACTMDGIGTTASLITIISLLWALKGLVFNILFASGNGLEKVKSEINDFRTILFEAGNHTPIASSLQLDAIRSRYEQVVAELDRVTNRQKKYKILGRIASSLLYHKIKALEHDVRLIKADFHTFVSLRSLARSSDSKQISDLSRSNRCWSADSVCSLAVSSSPPSVAYRGAIVEAAVHNPVSCMQQPAQNDRRSCVKYDKDCITPITKPAGILETSKHFHPEAYTNQSQVPNIVLLGAHTQKISACSISNVYRILYFKNSRKWFPLEVVAEIPRSSNYWQFAQLHQYRPQKLSTSCSLQVPTSLLNKLASSVGQLDLISEGRNMTILAIERQGDHCFHTQVVVRDDRPMISNTIIRTEQDVLNTIYHMGCPMVDEREVVRLACMDLPDRFLVSMDGHHVEEVFSMHRPPSPNFCYNLQLLYRLRSEPGFLRLVGTVVAWDTGLVKSYLTRWPDTPCELLLHRASTGGHPWERIEYWARHLLQRVSAVHAVGNVVGSLWLQRPPIVVDKQDELYLWRFDTRVNRSTTAYPFYPPEYRYLIRNVGDGPMQTEDCLVTPAYDVYQCGQLLWILASGWASSEKTALIFKEDMYRARDMWGVDPNCGVDPLPRLPPSVPAWFQDIVDACLSTANVRPSCQDLLARFPTRKCITATDTTAPTSTPELLSEATLRNCHVRSICCSKCYKQVVSVVYHCTICDGGDFDLCPDCWEKGLHCSDITHFMTEGRIGSFCPPMTRYHSSLSREGKRKVHVI